MFHTVLLFIRSSLGVGDSMARDEGIKVQILVVRWEGSNLEDTILLHNSLVVSSVA